MMNRRFQVIEQYFALLISVLVVGIIYNLFVVHPSLSQIGIHSILPVAPTSDAFALVVGIIGATVMPHALFVHSWLSKNKMDLLGQGINGNKKHTTSIKEELARQDQNEPSRHHVYSVEQKQRINKLHRNETVIALTIAGVVNAGILLVAIPLFEHGASENITVSQFVAGMATIYGPLIGILFALTLLASGLSSSALGTIAGQIIMEGLIGKHWNIWLRRIITRCVNVFPTTIAILLGLQPLMLLVYSQIILSLMIPLPMIPLVYYTSKRKIMGELVNRKFTIFLALITVSLILAFNAYLLITSI
jgi:manganese transport protein